MRPSKTGNPTKKETEHNVTFAEGGDTHMFGEQAAAPKVPGITGKKDIRGPGAKYAEGGRSKMFGYEPSIPAKSGITSAR